MIVSNQLQDLAKSIVADVMAKRGKNITHNICLEIYDGSESVQISIGRDGIATVVDGERATEQCDLRLRTSLETATRIKDGVLTIAEALSAGAIKIAGSVADVMATAADLGTESA